MEIPKFLILLSCIYSTFASHHSHTIPVEGYETDLQNLGEHVEIPETPVKVIKITKTIAVKIPVPYPVKVTEKVPYPVHVAKPYPVPVPQIIKVPHTVSPHGHDNSNDGHSDEHSSNNPSYQVQENSYSGGPYSEHNSESFGQEYPSADYNGGSSYEAPAQHYYGNGYSSLGGDSANEDKSYDQAIQEYLQKHNQQNAQHSGGASGYY